MIGKLPSVKTVISYDVFEKEIVAQKTIEIKEAAEEGK